MIVRTTSCAQINLGGNFMDEMQAIFYDPTLQVQNYSSDIVNNMTSLNILDLMDVKCWCKLLANTIVAYVSTIDIARGAGLIRLVKSGHPTSWMPNSPEYEVVRWKTFEQYYGEAIQDMIEDHDPMIRFLMPFNREWILLEPALGVVNRCNNATAKKFRSRAMRYIAGYIKNLNYQYHFNMLKAMKRENEELREKLESSNTERLLLMSIISEDPDRYRR